MPTFNHALHNYDSHNNNYSNHDHSYKETNNSTSGACSNGNHIQLSTPQPVTARHYTSFRTLVWRLIWTIKSWLRLIHHKLMKCTPILYKIYIEQNI